MSVHSPKGNLWLKFQMMKYKIFGTVEKQDFFSEAD